MRNKKIILGSKSPRRKQILEDAGFNVEVFSFDVPEDYPNTLKENEIAEFLAVKKHSLAFIWQKSNVWSLLLTPS
ncbi:MAG: Maf family protein [Saprospiraceae bacterium]|nr:Maf family protein [Saprospiraceae bacterium]